MQRPPDVRSRGWAGTRVADAGSMGKALRWAVLALALGGGDCRGGHTTKQGNFYVAMLGGDAWAPLAAGGTHMKISVSPAGSGCLGQHDATFSQVGSSDPT